MRKAFRFGLGITEADTDGRPNSEREYVVPTCGRADCSRPASARLMLDMANRVVSIDLEIEEVGAGLLCYNHAERIVVPRGWTLEDRRESDPYLFDGSPYDVEADTFEADLLEDEVRKPRKRAADRSKPERQQSDRQTELSLSDSTESASDGYDLPQEYRSNARTDPLAAPDSKSSPLLARAFEAAKPPMRRENTPKDGGKTSRT